MPDLSIVPMDTVVVAKHATDGFALAIDLKPIFVKPDATVGAVGVGDDGSRNALDAKGSLGCAPETVDARGMAAGPRRVSNTPVAWVLGMFRRGRKDVGNVVSFNVGFRRGRTGAATRSDTLVTFGRRANR